MAVKALMDEFDRIGTISAGTVGDWADRHAGLRHCRDLHDVLKTVSSSPDLALAALLSEAHSGCRIAALTVLRALLPKLIVLAAKDGEAGVGDYVSQMWIRIAGYPLERRPARIAANLVLDTLKAVRAERAHRLVPVADLDAGDEQGPPPAPEPDPRQLLGRAMDLGFVDPHTHGILVSVYAEGLGRRAVARRYHVSTTTIERRCHRGLKSLAAHARELADAL